MHFYCAALLYSCITGDSNLKVHIQKYPHISVHQWFYQSALTDLRITLSLKQKNSSECPLKQESHTVGQVRREGICSLRPAGPISLTWVFLTETFPSYSERPHAWVPALRRFLICPVRAFTSTKGPAKRAVWPHFGRLMCWMKPPEPVRP